MSDAGVGLPPSPGERPGELLYPFDEARAEQFIGEVVDLMDLTRREIADLDAAIEALCHELRVAERDAEVVAQAQARWDQAARAYADAYEAARTAAPQPFGDPPWRPAPPARTPAPFPMGGR